MPAVATPAPPHSTGLAPAPTAPLRPILKWAGGKRQLLPEIRRFYPREFRAYIEGFVGSGAVFFDLWNAGRLADRPATLLDANADLIGCYRALRDDAAAVVARLERLAHERATDPEAHYYEVRDGRFNPARRAIAGAGHPDPDRYSPELAAMLLYLNRTGFNGLFRLNAQGAFNVPVGRYTAPRICDAQNLRAAARVLGDGVTLHHGHFRTLLEHARAGDFIYLDPPYAPLSGTARFTSYTAGGFSTEDQTALQATVIELARRGCHVLLSNSTAEAVSRLYDGHPATRAVGLRAYRVPARRAINANGARRGPVMEYLISNIPRRRAS